MGVIILEFFEGIMDSKKYVRILQNNINKVKKMLKNGYYNEILIVYINQMSHKNVI